MAAYLWMASSIRRPDPTSNVGEVEIARAAAVVAVSVRVVGPAANSGAAAPSRVGLIVRGLSTDLKNGTVGTNPVTSDLCSSSAGIATGGGVLSLVAVVGAAINEAERNSPTITVAIAVAVFMCQHPALHAQTVYGLLQSTFNL